MTSAAFDENLRRLVAAGAEFVVIGGLALWARGVVRPTKDIDIVVSPDAENLKVVAEVAVAAGGHVQRGEALLGTPIWRAAGRGQDLVDLENAPHGARSRVRFDYARLASIWGSDCPLPKGNVPSDAPGCIAMVIGGTWRSRRK